jgi:hypothetical protein
MLDDKGAYVRQTTNDKAEITLLVNKKIKKTWIGHKKVNKTRHN